MFVKNGFCIGVWRNTEIRQMISIARYICALCNVHTTCIFDTLRMLDFNSCEFKRKTASICWPFPATRLPLIYLYVRASELFVRCTYWSNHQKQIVIIRWIFCSKTAGYPTGLKIPIYINWDHLFQNRTKIRFVIAMESRTCI